MGRVKDRIEAALRAEYPAFTFESECRSQENVAPPGSLPQWQEQREYRGAYRQDKSVEFDVAFSCSVPGESNFGGFSPSGGISEISLAVTASDNPAIAGCLTMLLGFPCSVGAVFMLGEGGMRGMPCLFLGVVVGWLAAMAIGHGLARVFAGAGKKESQRQSSMLARSAFDRIEPIAAEFVRDASRAP